MHLFEKDRRLGHIINAANKLKDKLSYDAEYAISTWQSFNWHIGELQTAFINKTELAKEVYQTFEPVRKMLKNKYGNTIRLYRAQSILKPDQIHQNRILFSWTGDLKTAKEFAWGNAKFNPPMTDEQIRKAVETFNKYGMVKVRGTTYRINKSNPEYTDMYKGKEYVTDMYTKELEDTLREYHQEWPLETEQKRKSKVKIYVSDVPIDKIVWVTNDLGSKEFICLWNPLKHPTKIMEDAPSSKPKVYDNLYHLTNYKGLAHSVINNAISALRTPTVSTTYDPTMNGVVGRDHYDFKFILDGRKIAETWDTRYHDEVVRLSNGTVESMNERELVVETKIIEPLDEYVKGIVILIPILSQKMIQWLFYRNNYIKGANALLTITNDWKKPLYKTDGKSFFKLDDNEKEFIKDAFNLAKRDVKYRRALYELSKKYNILSHDGDAVDKLSVLRRIIANKINKLFNAYYNGRVVTEVDPQYVRELVYKSLRALKLNDNIVATVMGAIEDAELFHPRTEAYHWSLVFDPLIKTGNVENALENIQYVKKELDRLKPSYENMINKEGSWKYGTFKHSGTMFHSLSNN